MANMGPADEADARDCWSVAFGNAYNDSERCVVAGYDNGDIKMFDLRTMSVRWETHLPNGVSRQEAPTRPTTAAAAATTTICHLHIVTI